MLSTDYEGEMRVKRVYNFSAGPAVLPESVLKKVQEELLSYQGSGMSVMELSHRSSLFEAIIQDAEALLRKLMHIPSNYHVLFLQGGASLQFDMIPRNLVREGERVGFIHTGSWSEKAIQAAQEFSAIEVEELASSADKNFSYIPDFPLLSEDYAYVHLTTNNTIEGTTIYEIPNYGEVPIVADMSSNILSSDYDIHQFGLIYAGAQKNIGPAGLTIVIIRDDLVGRVQGIPKILDYQTHIKNGSMYNTPPTFAIYVAKLVFEWLDDLGGVSAMEAQNRKKAGLLYDYIDQSDFFRSPVLPRDRSLTNIPFQTTSPELDKRFIEEAEANGLVNLKGHRSVGGMRASLYNAFPQEGVEALISFMDKFAKVQKGGRVHV